MCCRFGRIAEEEALAEAFSAEWEPGSGAVLAPSWNVAPQSFQPVVRLDGETGRRELATMRWGLVPRWSKEGKPSFSTFNARAETVATAPSFREPFRRQRCLIPANWYYEWQKIDEKRKQPYAIGLRSGALFAFAGLWDCWTDKATGYALQSFTIITTAANELTAPIHDRMPVILRPGDYEQWMETAERSAELLRPFPSEEMKAWKVSAAVGNVRNNSAELVEEARE